jgi:hypothetical protein
MQIVLNEQGFVDGYVLVGGFSSDSITVEKPEMFDDFQKNYKSYYLSEDGILVKNENRQKELEEAKKLNELRYQREVACFTYVNRGYLWYNKLTDEQKSELDTWYQAWLDVTETMVVPEKPEWLV